MSSCKIQIIERISFYSGDFLSFSAPSNSDVPEPSPKSGEEEAGEAGKKTGKEEEEEEDEEGEEEEEEAGETQGQASDSANSAIPPAQKSVAVVN